MSSPGNILFFAKTDPSTPPRPSGPTDCHWTWWDPSQGWRPTGCPRLHALAWTILHRSGIFAAEGFAARIAWLDGRPVHWSFVFPRWFRFPCMAAGDLQVGSIWTDPAQRGQGLASRAVSDIALRHASRRLWYITWADNHASRHIAEKCGFQLLGSGKYSRPLGIGFLGRYHLLQRNGPP